jgi:hypothetical protein
MASQPIWPEWELDEDYLGAALEALFELLNYRADVARQHLKCVHYVQPRFRKQNLDYEVRVDRSCCPPSLERVRRRTSWVSPRVALRWDETP